MATKVAKSFFSLKKKNYSLFISIWTNNSNSNNDRNDNSSVSLTILIIIQSQ